MKMLLTLIATACACSATIAEVRLSLFARGNGVPEQTYSQTLPQGTQISNSVASGGSAASGSADLSGGALRTFAQSSFSGGQGASANAVLGDSFTFSGPVGGVAYFDFLFEGTIALSSRPFESIASGQMSLTVFDPGVGTNVVYAAVLASSNCEVFSQANATLGCTVGSSISRTGSIAVPVGTGTFRILAGLSSTGSFSDVVDFSNTARFAWRLPDGVSVNSSTGQFLTSAPPILPIPEPSSLVLMAIGVAALLMRRPRSAPAR